MTEERKKKKEEEKKCFVQSLLADSCLRHIGAGKREGNS
jgi:hypothetical protein